MDTHDLNEALSGNFMLVEVKTTAWAPKRKSKRLTREVELNHNMAAGAVNVTKTPLPGADEEHKALLSAQRAVARYVYQHGLPWVTKPTDAGNDQGPRLVPSASIVDFMRDMKTLQSDYNAALLALEAVWPQRVATALANQGDDADPTLYPPQHEIASWFSVTVDYDTVPSLTDYSRVNIPARLAEALGERKANRQVRAATRALTDLRERIIEELRRTASQLSKVAKGEDTKLYKTMQTNLQELTSLLKGMSPILGESQTIDQLATMLDNITTHEPAVYKANPGLAGDVAALAEVAINQFEAELNW